MKNVIKPFDTIKGNVLKLIVSPEGTLLVNTTSFKLPCQRRKKINFRAVLAWWHGFERKGLQIHFLSTFERLPGRLGLFLFQTLGRQDNIPSILPDVLPVYCHQ